MMEQHWPDWVRERDDPRIAHTRPEALDDITVLDLSYKNFADGPHGSEDADWIQD